MQSHCHVNVCQRYEFDRYTIGIYYTTCHIIDNDVVVFVWLLFNVFTHSFRSFSVSNLVPTNTKQSKMMVLMYHICCAFR